MNNINLLNLNGFKDSPLWDWFARFSSNTDVVAFSLHTWKHNLTMIYAFTI